MSGHAKHGKSFTEGEFIKDSVTNVVEDILSWERARVG